MRLGCGSLEPYRQMWAVLGSRSKGVTRNSLKKPVHFILPHKHQGLRSFLAGKSKKRRRLVVTFNDGITMPCFKTDFHVQWCTML